MCRFLECVVVGAGDEVGVAPLGGDLDGGALVVHSYRHRFGLVDGDPAYQATEERIAGQPPITVPTIVWDGTHDGVDPPRSRDEHVPQFPALLDYRLLDAGHNVPPGDPEEFARAVTDLHRPL